MKNKNALTILLYVFAVLSLAYTCYAAIQAYNTFTSYYSTNLSVVNLVWSKEKFIPTFRLR